MKIGIVGHEAAKFNDKTEDIARAVIKVILNAAQLRGADTLVSGGCHLGGVDIYAEEEAAGLSMKTQIHLPQNQRWKPHGYRARNIKIASDSDELHVIVVKRLPDDYDGMKFKYCYHCIDKDIPDHIKSGGCWTAWKANGMGKPTTWHIIDEETREIARKTIKP
jgi:hypothetical protein